MGLFDNLFLDKDTPMAINNGEEHPVIQQKVATPAKATETAKAEQAISSAETAIGKADTVADLFAPEKAKEVPQVEDVKPKDDIQFSAAIAAPTQEASSPELSFDIGGDISFDIGGDIGLPEAPSVVDSVAPVAVEPVAPVVTESEVINTISLENTPSVVMSSVAAVATSPEPIVENTIQVDSIPAVTPSVEMNSGISDDSALFSLLNDSTNSATQEEDKKEESQNNTTEPLSIQEKAIEPLIGSDLAPESTPTPVVGAIIEKPLDTIIPVESTQENNLLSMSDTVDTLASSSIIFHSVEDIASENTLQTENILPQSHMPHFSQEEGSTSSGSAESKFNAKLQNFIQELRNLEAEDQIERAEKLKQAELFRARAKTCREEAEAHALALEEDAKMLERQAESIAADKAHINSVISGFRDKFSVV